MRSNKKWDELYRLGEEAYTRGKRFEDITDQLLGAHNDEALVYAVIRKLKSDHYAEQRKQGFMVLAAGLVIILAGFIITCFNFYSSKSVAFAMYGLTTLGITVVFVGLYKIIG